jgi:hypothetical protein
MPRHISPLKNNLRNLRKIYYNSIRVINGEFSQHTTMPHHLSSLKNNSINSRKCIFLN